MATIDVSSETLQQWEGMLSALRGAVAPSGVEVMDSLLQSIELAQKNPEAATPSDSEDEVRQAVAHDALDQLAEWKREGVWEAVSQFMALLTSVKNSATAPMVERMGNWAVIMGTLMSRATDADVLSMMESIFEHHEDITVMLDQLGTWQSNGTWHKLVDLVAFVAAAVDSLSVATVEHLTTTVQKTGRNLSAVMDSPALPMSMALLDAIGEARQEAALDSKPLTLRAMLRLIKDPQVQLSLKTLFGVLKKMPQVLNAE